MKKGKAKRTQHHERRNRQVSFHYLAIMIGIVIVGIVVALVLKKTNAEYKFIQGKVYLINYDYGTDGCQTGDYCPTRIAMYVTKNSNLGFTANGIDNNNYKWSSALPPNPMVDPNLPDATFQNMNAIYMKEQGQNLPNDLDHLTIQHDFGGMFMPFTIGYAGTPFNDEYLAANNPLHMTFTIKECENHGEFVSGQSIKRDAAKSDLCKEKL